jgi:glutamate-ammonia-ligase adenylyltransferase
MQFRAETFSGFFRRAIFAMSARGEPLEAIETLASAPIDEARIAGLVESCRPSENPGRALRRARRLLLLALMERDIRGDASLEEVCAAMTSFATQATSVALRAAASDLVEQFGVPLDSEGEPQDLLAIAMGKGGAGELNVSSDLDLVFLHRDRGETSGIQADGSPARRGTLPSAEFFHRLARRAIGLLSEVDGDGFVFRIDTRLRPNGDSGPLVGSLAMLEEYFYAQGREWERFAWLKGRVVADSGMAGEAARRADEQALAQIVEPFVFRRYLDYDVFEGLRAVHALIRSEANRREARRQGNGLDVKLGRGGIREIEFAAQLFQIVRGGRDPGLRNRATLPTLAAIGERGLLPAGDVALLVDAYRLLRRTEHMLQYREDEQTHRLPEDPAVRADVAAMLRMTVQDFEAAIAAATAAVDRIFNDLLAEPDREDEPEGGLDEERLDEDVARLLKAMREGPRYRAARDEAREAIERLLAIAQARDTPPRGMKGLIELCETVCRRPSYLALLARHPDAFDRVLRMISRSQWATSYLVRHPIVLDELIAGHVLEPIDFDAWEAALRERLDAARIEDQPDTERQMDIAREVHHATAFRLLAQDIEGMLTVERLSDLLSEIADRMLGIAMEYVWPQCPRRHRDVPRIAAIAYGRLGGKELGYTSDLDLVFVYDDEDKRAQEAYSIFVRRLNTWLSAQTAAGVLFEIDLRLRPNGDAGLLATSLAAFERYQREEAWVWEHQALTRARYCAGDAAIGARFEAVRREILARPRDAGKLRDEIVAMRKRMHQGHPNRSELFDLKHDAGGMVDIEFIVQYLVLLHSAQHPALLDNAGNIALLGRAADAGLLEPARARRLADAYRRYRRLQHAVRLDGAQYARVDPAEVADEAAAVSEAWAAIFG